MFEPTARVLVCVSGGKDSLALWNLLDELSYKTVGLYVGLGIGDYSDESFKFVEAFAARKGLELQVFDLQDDAGYNIDSAARSARRPACSVCGVSKRHVFNSVALAGGFDAVATGHNLDDEAAVLMGNLLHWDLEYLARQLPVLEESQGFVRKVKPLVRLTERELAAYCVLERIDYMLDECPNAVGNRHLNYKAALNVIEEASPGSKAAMYNGFVEKAHRLLSSGRPDVNVILAPCESCGAPTPSGVCSFCRLLERAGAHPAAEVAVQLRRARLHHGGGSNG